MTCRQRLAVLAGAVVATTSLLAGTAPAALAADPPAENVRWVQVAPDEEDGAQAGDPVVPGASVYSANGCTWGRGGGTVCGDVQGSKKHVNSLHISRQYPGMVCDYKGHWKVTNSSGATIASGSSSRANCTPGAAYFHWQINKSYPAGTKVTLTWFREGGRDGAVAFQLKG
ncbi:hypothetical protein LG634_32205 [Streptomyces bambusae]|uniref:hypothetical protein n=1 Tax=Streptomyces bambusae TaxID=1550616 RepID=UPI001CFFD7CA|nr:hypothetical protein [Streptomyces bambusae]MCB5169458.1 hypothetical protein [Streptomyces bambusae]